MVEDRQNRQKIHKNTLFWQNFRGKHTKIFPTNTQNFWAILHTV